MNPYTHGHAEPVLRSHRWRTAENSAAYLLTHLRPDQTLLDIGCGPGTLTADLAAHVEKVIALEISEDALTSGRAELARRGTANVNLLVGDVHHLDMQDNSVDVVHAHQVLQHVADPVQALREMLRVCRPGGVVAVRDCDYEAFTWWPAVPALSRWLELYRVAARANDAEPDAGRRLLSWALAAGFSDVTPSSSTWTYATEDDRAWWGGMWADRILGSTLTDQLLETGLASRDELQMISAGWREWAAAPDGWLMIPHGELVCRV